MNVTVESAAMFSGMVEAFGLPTLRDSKFPELFGCYHYDDETRYFSYEPGLERWSVKSGRGHPDYWELSCETWSDDDLEEVTERMGELSLMKKPPVPTDGAYREEPQFIYNGWLFAWTFIPQLKRWELAPIGRR